MISVIVCSVSQERLQRLCKNVDETIGVEYEMVAVDNRQLGWPIARVYNEGARRASGRCLLFVHEDVVFHQQDWGRALIGRLASPDCGVIGFAGSKVKLDVYSGWWQNHAGWDCCSYIQNGVRCVQGGRLQEGVLSFEPVVTLDGFALLVRREVWEEFPFDEDVLKGFHCYDLDFTLAVGRKYTNYVCGGIAVEHLSSGNLDGRWYETTVQLHDTKWNPCCPYGRPMSVGRRKSGGVRRKTCPTVFCTMPYEAVTRGNDICCTLSGAVRSAGSTWNIALAVR